MSFFLSLFDETKNSNIKKNHLKRHNKKCKYLSGVENILPEFTFPHVGSEEFNGEINDVVTSYLLSG